MPDNDVICLARNVLKAKKGAESFAPLLIAECGSEELPPTLTGLLLDIDACLSKKTAIGRGAPGEDNADDTGTP